MIIRLSGFPSCSVAVTQRIRTFSTRAENELRTEAKDEHHHILDISGLKARHRVIAAGGMPPLEFNWERQRKGQRERFGIYGLKSGIDPSICWPTVEEIEEEQAVGLYREYETCIREMKVLKQSRQAEEVARIEELENNLKNYPDKLAKYEMTLVKAEKERDAKEIALENRIREIQEYFGYWIDPNDQRFEVMLRQKEEEEKKAAKMARRAELQKKTIADVFPELDVVGWYCTGGDGLEQSEILLQSLFAAAIDSPLIVKLDPTADSQSRRNVPVKVYCGRETLVSTGHSLVELDWTLVSEQSERIGIDHITRLSQAGDDGAVSSEGKQMRAVGSAIGMLLDRMEIICKYLKGVEEGKFLANDEIIRETNKLCQRIPLLKPAEFDKRFNMQERDARAAMLLAKMTETCGTLSSLQAKTNVLGTVTAWRSFVTFPTQQPKKKISQRSTGSGNSNPVLSTDLSVNNDIAHSPEVD
ncbi:hypothetical protein DICVIV_09139 [Dictyocaulus viviparus]|uniref:EIF3F/CSN6-like C-terminal domain-containing protein n=1 Tax=Dictyocaulus viviparus TaxID=29172 RepID=A0A0D8XJP3_DICVI|nr:hypothetical protein DICVIV_09139 [Dictyocaulus viviparus]